MPLILGKGRLQYFQEPLYIYSSPVKETHRSYTSNFAATVKHKKGHFETVKETITRLPICSREKQRLLAVTDLSFYKKLILCRNTYDPAYKETAEHLLNEYVGMVNNNFTPSPHIKRIFLGNEVYFIKAVEDNIIGLRIDEKIKKPKGRTIAWGAMGKRGQKLLPHLMGTPLEPDELWDTAGDNDEIKKPNPSSLSADDLVFVLPVGEISDQICRLLEITGCAVVDSNDIEKHISYFEYPQFYDCSLSFMPEGV
jgi:hypothetical protein